MSRCYTAVIWGVGSEFARNYNGIRLQEQLGCLKVLGVLAKERGIYKKVYGYPSVEYDDIFDMHPDLIILNAREEKRATVYHMAAEAGMDRGRILRGDVFNLPEFKLDRYMELRDNPVSIICDNCFGGFIYHRLDLRFSSPTINMWFEFQDFIRLVKGLRKYMSQEIHFDHYGWEAHRNSRYPIMHIPDAHGSRIYAHCNHTDSYGYAREKWEERKKLINYDNILVIMRAHNLDELAALDEIPYRKICFTCFKNRHRDIIYLPSDVLNKELWQVENAAAKGNWPFFNPIKLLLGDSGFMTAEME